MEFFIGMVIMKRLAGFYVIPFGTMIGKNVAFKFIQSMAKTKQLFIIHLRKLFLLSQVVLFASCFPVVGQFYVPSLERGEEGVYSRCFDHGKTPIGIRVYKDGIKIETVFVNYRDAEYLKVLIQIPESETVKLHEHAAQVYFDENPLPLIHVLYHDGFLKILEI